jgi:hypothetical protein
VLEQVVGEEVTYEVVVELELSLTCADWMSVVVGLAIPRVS